MRFVEPRKRLSGRSGQYARDKLAADRGDRDARHDAAIVPLRLIRGAGRFQVQAMVALGGCGMMAHLRGDRSAVHVQRRKARHSSRHQDQAEQQQERQDAAMEHAEPISLAGSARNAGLSGISGRMAHHIHHHGHGKSSAIATSAQATLHCLTGCVIGEVAGLAIGVTLGLGVWPTIVLATLLSYISGRTPSVKPEM